MSDQEAQAALVSIKGIGPWSANVYLLMALKRPDIWPTGDVALATAVGKTSNPATTSFLPPTRRDGRSVATVSLCAARMLWQYYSPDAISDRAKRSPRFGHLCELGEGRTLWQGSKFAHRRRQCHISGWPDVRPLKSHQEITFADHGPMPLILTSAAAPPGQTFD